MPIKNLKTHIQCLNCLKLSIYDIRSSIESVRVNNDRLQQLKIVKYISEDAIYQSNTLKSQRTAGRTLLGVYQMALLTDSGSACKWLSYPQIPVP